jgi:hypothetical protein
MVKLGQGAFLKTLNRNLGLKWERLLYLMPWPVAVRAQQRLRRLGVLMGTEPETWS